MAKQPFVMNLQLFADTQPLQGEPAPQAQPDLKAQALAILQGGENTPAQAAPQGQPQTGDNPQNSPQNLQNSGQTPNQPQGTEQPIQAPGTQDQMLLGKFKSPQDLAQAYVNLEKFNTQTRQELSQVQQAAQAAQTAVLQMQQQMQQQVQAQQPQEPELSPEEANEQLMNRFYENPSQFFQELQQQAKDAALQELAPVQQYYQQQQKQAQMDMAISQFAQQNPDFQQFSPIMSQILEQNPELNQHDPTKALSIAYQMARGQNYQNPSMLLQDQNFVSQNIMNNQEIKNQIIQEYLQGLQTGNQAPTVIAGQANGQTTVTPQNQPQTIKDARNIALQYFKK